MILKIFQKQKRILNKLIRFVDNAMSEYAFPEMEGINGN